MRVTDVCVRVHEMLVSMRMAVRPGRVHSLRMCMLVMGIVHMPMIVLERFVHMDMLVTISDEEPNTDGHHSGRDEIESGPRLVEERNRQHRPRERCRREDRSLTRRAEQPQRIRVEQDADPVGERTEHERAADNAPRRARLTAHDRQ